MARSLSIVALLAASVLFVGAADEGSKLNIAVGCNESAAADVCDTCSAAQTEYNANAGCHKYKEYPDNSYKVTTEGELVVYGDDNCASPTSSTVVKLDTCMGNYTSAFLTVPVEGDKINVTFCYPTAKPLPCKSLVALEACYSLPLTPTKECKKASDVLHVAYTAALADGKVDLAVYLNMAECQKKQLLVFSKTGMTANDTNTCHYYQPRYNLTTIGAPGRLPTTTASTGVSAQDTLMAVALIVVAYMMSL